MNELAVRGVPVMNWIERVLNEPGESWLIPGFIPAKGLTLLTGRPKTAKKSWMAQLMGLAVSSGVQVGPFKPTQKGNVLYYHREGPAIATAHRFKALATSYSRPMTDYVGYYIVPFGNFFIDDPLYIEESVQMVREKGIDLVIIDTFARSFLGDENSSRDVMKAVRCLDLLRDAGAAVVLVHHAKKGRTELRGSEPDPDAGIRGSGALAGAYDHIISLQDLVVNDEAGIWAIVGGKSQDYVAYKQKWSIRDDLNSQVISAQLTLEGPQDLPQVDETLRKGRRDKGKED